MGNNRHKQPASKQPLTCCKRVAAPSQEIKITGSKIWIYCNLDSNFIMQNKENMLKQFLAHTSVTQPFAGGEI